MENQKSEELKEEEVKEKVNEEVNEEETEDENKTSDASLNTEEDKVKEENTKKDKKDKKNKHFDITKEEAYIALVNENALLKDQLLRKQAEFENFRKRTQEERTRERKYALQDFLSEAIETTDIFDKAVNVQTEDEKLKKYLIGFNMINNRLKNLMENYGVTPMEPLNKPFDPNLHDALETVEVEGVESGIVVEVIQRGYMYKDRVLRHAMVKVSK